MAEHVEVLITEEDVDARIQAIGEQISRDYQGRQVHLVCVLKGGSFFMCELAKRISVPVVDVHVDYTGFQIPDEFVVGYGLDYDQRYRNLPYIGVVKFETEMN